MLPSLHIQGFRCFRELTIERLGRVNLIVGKNNIGKTTFLEALRLHAAQDDALFELQETLKRRGEFLRTRRESESPQRLIDWLRAFHDADVKNEAPVIEIGPCDRGDSSLQLKFDGNLRSRGVQLQSWIGAERTSSIDLDEVLRDRPPSPRSLPCQYIPANGLPAAESSRLWDDIVLTEHEETCLEALRIIEPDVQRVALVDVPMADGGWERAPHVARSSRRQPEPLDSLGEGMNRIFDIMLGLTNARGGRLLIDEIENGLHHSIHEMLWRHIFDVAAKLDVQVFATTHSWGCIDAFQAAARAHPDDGILIRLDRRESESIAYLFDEDELAVVSEQAIEVR